jgi:hypothetical protein
MKNKRNKRMMRWCLTYKMYIYRQAASIANIPATLLFAPEEAADRMKRATIPVADI